MLDDLDETLRLLLREELNIKNGEIDIKFDQPKREWSSKLTRPTINLYLYDIRENTTLRAHQWQRQANKSPLIASRKRTPFRFDCFYMLTVWTPSPPEPEDEHRLLTLAMLALLRNPIIREDQLVGSIQNQPFDVTSQLGLPTKLTNPAEVWGAMDNEIRPTIPFIITIALDPWDEVAGPMVSEFMLRIGQAEGLPHRPKMTTIAQEMLFIGGTVRNKDGDPQPNISVSLEGERYNATTMTNDDGRYTLGGMQAGDYTLFAKPPKGRRKQKKIAVPIEDGDFDITI